MKRNYKITVFFGFLMGLFQAAGALNAQEIYDFESYDRMWQEWRVYLNGPINYLLTQNERQKLESFQGDENRIRRFAQQFWLTRKPRSGGRRNLFESELKETIWDVNKRFREGDIPGWQTHRGIMFIVFGEPEFEENWLMPGIRVPSSQRKMVKWWYSRDRVDPDKYNPKQFIFTFIDEERDGRFILYPNLSAQFGYSKKKGQFQVMSLRSGYYQYRKNGIPHLLFEWANQNAIVREEVDQPYSNVQFTEGDTQSSLPVKIVRQGIQPQGSAELAFQISYVDIPYVDEQGVQKAKLDCQCLEQGVAEAEPILNSKSIEINMDELVSRVKDTITIVLTIPDAAASYWSCWCSSTMGRAVDSRKMNIDFKKGGE